MISEVFSSSVTLRIEIFNLTVIQGEGVWIASQPHGKSLEKFVMRNFDHQNENVFRLQRFDLHKSFEIFGFGSRNFSCIERNEEGDMPLLWGWLQTASYAAKVINGHDYDVWSVTKGYATVSVAVVSSAVNTPVYLTVTTPARSTQIKFETFDSDPPREAHFDVPATCKNPIKAPTSTSEGVSCASRSAIIDRAQVWVNNHVPYSQTSTYQGYRTDCSGYVSMAWAVAKPGYTTFTLPSISHPISKNDLQEGDILLCRTEHVVLFGGWTSAARSEYIAYEETRPGEGTVKRATPYPYWYNTGCFLPYRYNSVC